MPGVCDGEGEGPATPSVRSPDVAVPFDLAELAWGVVVRLSVPATPSVGVEGVMDGPELFSLEPEPGTGEAGLPATPSVGVEGLFSIWLACSRSAFIFFLAAIFLCLALICFVGVVSI